MNSILNQFFPKEGILLFLDVTCKVNNVKDKVTR